MKTKLLHCIVLQPPRHKLRNKMNQIEKYGLSEQYKNLATMYTNMTVARVLRQDKGQYRIVTSQGVFTAEVSGKFRYETGQLVDFPTVGDFVMVTNDGVGDLAIIHHVLKRKSLFVRTAVGVKGQAQAIAANIDIVFICMSLNENYNLSRLERYLSIAWDSEAKPVVLLTKSDLCEDLQGCVREVERVSSYADVITLSKYDEDIEGKLSSYLNTGSTMAFIGSSGVGKSTLINKLLGEERLATADIGKGAKGRHTTTGKEMYISSQGDVLIDTPGMRELGAQSVNLSNTFDDIEELAGECRYSDCSHTAEKGCAILRAIEEDVLDKRRYDSYLKLKKEVSYEGLSDREIEAKKWERFGGVKNIRRIGNEGRKFKKNE